MSARSRSLVQRLAWTTWAAVAGSAACVALVSLLLADRFAEQHEEQHLTDAATLLLAKLESQPTTATAVEARETLPTGVRVAAYRGQQFFAGDQRVARPSSAGCTMHAAVAVCAAAGKSFFTVATSDRAALLRRQRSTMLLPSLLAVLFTAVAGAFLARHIAARAVAPLSRLSDALERVPPDAPERADLGPSEGVAEVDALRSALRQTFDRLGRSLSTTRRFASDAAHELRSPLAVIMGQLELGASTLSGEARESVQKARATAARLATLVERLLVLATPASKLAKGERIELHGAVDDALDLIPMGAWPRVTVSADGKAYVTGDRALLASMIANGIENALKFSETNVSVKLSSTIDHATVQIADEGPGIPEAYRGRVFEPFFRTPEARGGSVRGHGIGLSLIAHVAGVHGGAPRFVACARGACLVIELPRAD